MLISEKRLRKLIRSGLIHEGYTPTVLFEPVLYGYEEKSAVNAGFLGGDNKTGISFTVKRDFRNVFSTRDSVTSSE